MALPATGNGTVPADIIEAAAAAEFARSEHKERATQAPATRHRTVTVVVTTCANPGPLERCLEAVLACDPAPDEVVVVENRPGTGVTAALLAERFASRGVLLVEEPRRGLSWARNAGLFAAEGEVVAFTDDDVVVDPGWVRHLTGGFDRNEDVACVTGLILPLRLDTEAQLLLEQFAGFSKGFRTREWRLSSRAEYGPLFPYTCGEFGSGANTAVLAAAARALGGFDVRLGAGTAAWGGEELDLYVRLLHAGHALVYEPAALLWHDHPDHLERLRSEAFHYGIGLTAMLTKHLLTSPERLDMLHRIPGAVRHIADPGSRKNANKQEGYPTGLNTIERVGMLLGPAAYARSCLAGTVRST
jgi:GT2 family glycosyltransferase